VGAVVVVVVVDLVSGGGGAGSVVVVVLLVVVVAGSVAGAGVFGVTLLVVLCEQPTIEMAPAKITARRLVVFIIERVSRSQTGLSRTARSANHHS
jgi:hypothetical protein